MEEKKEKGKNEKRDNPLPREKHEVGVKHNRQHEVTDNHNTQRPDSEELSDLPVPGQCNSADNHTGSHDDAENESVLEVLDDLADFLEESRVFGFLAGGAPVHFNAEHVRQEGLRQMHGETAEEDGHHGDPHEVGDESAEQVLLVGTVAKDGEGDVTETGENDKDGEVDLERIQVVLVLVRVVPAEKEVVENGQDPSAADGVVSTDVGHDSKLRRKGHSGADEVAEELGERTASRPVADRVEQELVASVGVFLPTSKFVVDGKRDTFLETIAGVTTHADNVTIVLEAESHVEIFRDSLLGPVLFAVVISAVVGNVLNRRPSQDSVVTDERSNISTGDSILDLSVDEVGEESDTLFEEAVGDVHDTRGVLENGDLRRLVHFTGGIEQTIGRDTRIGIDEKKVVTKADVTVSPSATFILLDNLVEGLDVDLGLVIVGPVGVLRVCVHLVLDTVADPHGVVHVGGLLELSATKEGSAVLTLGIVTRTSDPSDVVLVVEVLASAGLLFRDQLHTIVVDEDVGSTALHLVGGDGSLDGVDSGLNDTNKTLLVNGTLDGDVRESDKIGVEALGGDTRVELGVGGQLRDRTEELSDVSDKSLEEEERDPHLGNETDHEGQTSVATIVTDFDGDLAPTQTHDNNDQTQCQGVADGLGQDDTARLLVCASLFAVGAELVDIDLGVLLLL
jgi:hypothetical protein